MSQEQEGSNIRSLKRLNTMVLPSTTPKGTQLQFKSPEDQRKYDLLFARSVREKNISLLFPPQKICVMKEKKIRDLLGKIEPKQIKKSPAKYATRTIREKGQQDEIKENIKDGKTLIEKK